MKKAFLFIVIYSAFTFCYAQDRNTFFIRNYRADLSVQFNTDLSDRKEHNIENYKKEDKTYYKDNRKKDLKSSFSLFDGYGAYIKSQPKLNDSYSFQGQQYNPELALYFFPFRTYSSVKKRFLQVDPKSQYFSPYNFVGSNPVNNIDRDGNQSKPLYIFGENHDDFYSLDKLPYEDVRAELADGYVVPMSDIVNGDVIALPDWNGDVFIFTHTSPVKGSEIEVERGSNPQDFKTEGLDEITMSDGRVSAQVSGEYVGERLRELSVENNVDLHNVFVGSCEGSAAAEGISTGYIGKSKTNLKGIKARFIGAKKGIHPHIESQSIYNKNQLTPIEKDRLRFHYGPETDKIYYRYYEDADQNAYLRLRSLTSHGRINGTLPSVNSDEINGLIQGRIPKNAEPVLDVIEKIY